VCKCDLQTSTGASCTPGHLCYDENCRLLPVGSGSVLCASYLDSRPRFRRLDRSLPMWSGRLHMNRHPGQVMDGHCERIDKTLSLCVKRRISISSCCSFQIRFLFPINTILSHLLNTTYLTFRSSIFITRQSFYLSGVDLENIIHDLCNPPSVFCVLFLRRKQQPPSSSSQCPTAKAATKPSAVWASSNSPASALTVTSMTWVLHQTRTTRAFLRLQATFHCAQYP
jgi:hypothetical protein